MHCKQNGYYCIWPSGVRRFFFRSLFLWFMLLIRLKITVTTENLIISFEACMCTRNPYVHSLSEFDQENGCKLHSFNRSSVCISDRKNGRINAKWRTKERGKYFRINAKCSSFSNSDTEIISHPAFRIRVPIYIFSFIRWIAEQNEQYLITFLLFPLLQVSEIQLWNQTEK